MRNAVQPTIGQEAREVRSDFKPVTAVDIDEACPHHSIRHALNLAMPRLKAGGMSSAFRKWASLKGMAKLRSARPKKSSAPPVRGGLPCVIFVIAAVILVSVFLFVVMKYAG